MLGCGGVLFLALGCGDGGSGPNPGGDGPRLAAQFERLADSVANAGYSPTAEALRHAAEIVRLAGGATSVTLRVDGATRSFLAVAEQIDFPNLICSWPADSGIVIPGDSGIAVPADSVIPMPGTAPSIEPYPGDCTVVDTSSMRTLIAWEPVRMAEVVRIVGDIGGGGVQPTVPDVMVALPATPVEPTPPAPSDPPDSAVSGGGNDGSGGGGGGGGYPGFMGEYLVRDVGSWWAVEGEQSNALAELSGACTADRATIDWAEFTCSAARFRFGFSMRVEALRYEPLMQTEPGGEPGWDGAVGSHVIELEQTTVSGVRLTVVGWTPPPVPPPLPPGPPPIDSSTVSP
jgi:hypothetical protein